MIWNTALAITGTVMIRQLSAQQLWARYFGFCLMTSFAANFPLVMSLFSGNFGGFTKKMTVNGMVCSVALIPTFLGIDPKS